jgi:hypothetical protein
MRKLLNVGLGDVDKFTNKNKNSHTFIIVKFGDVARRPLRTRKAE